MAPNERRMMTIFYFRRTNIAGKLYTKHTSIWFSQVAFVYDRYSSNGNGNGSDTVLHLIICGYLTNDKKGKRVRNGTKTRQRWREWSICHNGTNERKTVHTISNDSKYTHTHSHTLRSIRIERRVILPLSTKNSTALWVWGSLRFMNITKMNEWKRKLRWISWRGEWKRDGERQDKCKSIENAE